MSVTIMTRSEAPGHFRNRPEWNRGEVLLYRGHTLDAVNEITNRGGRAVKIGGDVYEWVSVETACKARTVLDAAATILEAKARMRGGQ